MTMKKFLAHIRLGKAKEIEGVDPKPLPSLKRTNAKVSHRHNSNLEFLPAGKVAQQGSSSANGPVFSRMDLPVFAQYSRRSYSFELGASVERLEAGVHVQSSRLQKKRSQQVSTSSAPLNVPKPKFGLKVNNLKLPALADGPSYAERTVPRKSSPYGEIVIPDDQDDRVEYALYTLAASAKPSASSGSEVQASEPESAFNVQSSGTSRASTWQTTSSEADPLEEAKTASLSRETLSIANGRSTKRRPDSSPQDSRMADFLRAQGSHESLNIGSRVRLGNDRGSLTDSGVLLGGDLNTSDDSVADWSLNKGKGKAREHNPLAGLFRRGPPSGSYAVQEWQATGIGAQLYDDIESLKGYIRRQEQDQADRLKCMAQQQKGEQEGTSRRNTEEADRILAEEIARKFEEGGGCRLRECIACAGMLSSSF